MRTVNKVILIGNVTRDPSVKNTENDRKISLFTVATNRYFKTSDGQTRNESEFHNCVAWGTLAERVAEHLVKGKLVYVEGRLRTRIIEKEDGTKSYKTEVVVTNLIFLNKRSDFAETESTDSFDSFEEDLDDDKF